MTIETQPYAYREPPQPLRPAHVLLNGKHAPRTCANYHCSGPSDFLNTPFCDDCIWRLWAHIDSVLPDAEKELAKQNRFEEIHLRAAHQNTQAQRWQEASAESRRAEFMTMPGTVYYLRVGDLVKIGWTIDLEQRMRQYPPNSVLLATHPGTRETERQMHHKFLHRVSKGREWFAPCQEIDQHIESVRTQFTAA